ncbi:MAG: hypothetical protein C0606_01340 [Hyphomicrobiales bacterium]|nr:MAG: hypothetical protein C0606_01340 [Hyphomicrobiales bacterium]
MMADTAHTHIRTPHRRSTVHLFCEENCAPFAAWRDFAKVLFVSVLLLALFAGPVALLRLNGGGEKEATAFTELNLCQKVGGACDNTVTGTLGTR